MPPGSPCTHPRLALGILAYYLPMALAMDIVWYLHPSQATTVPLSIMIGGKTGDNYRTPITWLVTPHGMPRWQAWLFWEPTFSTLLEGDAPAATLATS